MYNAIVYYRRWQDQSSILFSESIYSLDKANFNDETADIIYENGTDDGVNYRIRAVMRFGCEEGFAMEGIDERRLLTGGVWSHTPPTCKGTQHGQLKPSLLHHVQI